MSHTPGPWERIPSWPPRIMAPDGVAITDVFTGRQNHENEANASLIAAAPDLLAACEAAMKLWDRHETIAPTQGEADLVRAAIAKAKGDLT